MIKSTIKKTINYAIHQCDEKLAFCYIDCDIY